MTREKGEWLRDLLVMPLVEAPQRLEATPLLCPLLSSSDWLLDWSHYLRIHHALLCYAMLCYAMLCYATLSYAMLCYVMWCSVMKCHTHHVVVVIRTTHCSTLSVSGTLRNFTNQYIVNYSITSSRIVKVLVCWPHVTCVMLMIWCDTLRCDIIRYSSIKRQRMCHVQHVHHCKHYSPYWYWAAMNASPSFHTPNSTALVVCLPLPQVTTTWE